MTRKSHPALPSFGKSLSALAGLTLAAAAFAAPAQATTITFEGGAGAAYGSGESYSEGGYRFGFWSPFDNTDTGDGSLVGVNIDGADPSWCASMACPTGTSGSYYGAMNDSSVSIISETGNPFQLQGFDASFIGYNPELNSYMDTVGLVLVLGLTATGDLLQEEFWLDGPGASGFGFQNFATSVLAGQSFVEMLMFGYACGTDLICRAEETNKAQFAIDNLVLVADGAADVPEPATGLLLGIGLMGLLARARRRTA